MFVSEQRDIPLSMVSSEYDLATRRNLAASWMENWVLFQKSIRTSVCVVFDIDDTLISAKRPMEEIVGLLHRLHAQGVVIFIVTARMKGAEFEAKTREHLEEAGITDDMYAKIFMMPREIYEMQSMDEVAKYKYGCRKTIRKSHFIAGNLGDMMSDLCKQPLPQVEHLSPDDLYVFIHPHEKTACLKLNERVRSG